MNVDNLFDGVGSLKVSDNNKTISGVINDGSNNIIQGTISVGKNGCYTITDGGGNIIGVGVSGGPAIATTKGVTYPAPVPIMTAQQGVSNQRQRYGYQDRLDLVDGDIVEVDFSYFGTGEKWEKVLEAVVIGRVQHTDSNSDSWVLDFGDSEVFGEHYRYRAMVVPTCAILKPELMKWE